MIIYKFLKLINDEHNLFVLNTDQMMRSQDEAPVFSLFITFSLWSMEGIIFDTSTVPVLSFPTKLIVILQRD